MHHCRFSHGLSSFFLTRVAPSHGSRFPRFPARPACQRPSAYSSVRIRPVAGCTSGRPGALPARRPASASLVGAVVGSDLAPPLTPLSPTPPPPPPPPI